MHMVGFNIELEKYIPHITNKCPDFVYCHVFLNKL